MLVSITVTPVSESTSVPIHTASALPGACRAPIPYPIECSSIAGRRKIAVAPRMAAPVGVTSSRVSSVASNTAPVPARMRTLAGAGSGMPSLDPRGAGSGEE